MRELQQKIKAKERAIAKNSAKIYRLEQLLKPYFKSKAASRMGILGSFTTGFLISRKKTWIEVVTLITSSSLTLFKIGNFLKAISLKSPDK